jgi:hypothetical protein
MVRAVGENYKAWAPLLREHNVVNICERLVAIRDELEEVPLCFLGLRGITALNLTNKLIKDLET